MDIKPITIKPITPAGASPAAPAADSPASAPSVPPSGIKPISIKPMVAPTLKPADSGDGESATIRLKPVPPAGTAPAAPTPLKPMPLKPVPLTAPPAGPAAAPAPMQALKGKTSRISLDSALASPPTAAAAPAMGKITTNLSAAAQAAKGQTAKVSLTIVEDDAMTRHQTLRMKAPAAKPATPAPAAPKPAAEDASEAPTIRKKTLVLKKDGAESSAPAAAPASGDGDTKPTLRLKPQEGGATAATKPKLIHVRALLHRRRGPLLHEARVPLRPEQRARRRAHGLPGLRRQAVAVPRPPARHALPPVARRTTLPPIPAARPAPRASRPPETAAATPS